MITLLLFACRREGVTPAQFREHYETHHMPLIRSLFGEAFPATHERQYVVRPEASAANDGSFPAKVIAGSPNDITFDAVSKMTFRDAEHFDRFMAAFGNEAVMGKLREDESNFLDGESIKAVLVESEHEKE